MFANPYLIDIAEVFIYSSAVRHGESCNSGIYPGARKSPIITKCRRHDLFIRKHKYPFLLLLDRLNPNDSTRFQVVDKYNVHGIPTKFVIGPGGHIRFRSVGYYGNISALVREVDMMISLVRKAGVRASLRYGCRRRPI